MIGTVIGNYRIVRTLGKGGMGSVYLAEHTRLGRRAAIKVLLPELSRRDDIIERFFNEARAATAVNDPGIIQIFDFGNHTDGSAYIVMEYLEGETLHARLRRLGRLGADEAMRVARQIATSLEAAHAKGVVHRDLKPENIYIVPDAEAAAGERAKVLDFGIAKLSDDQPSKVKTSAGAILGTPLYMSPEQCRGGGEVDHRADVYALGCVLHAMLTGRPPFDGAGSGEVIAMHLREPAPPPSAIAVGLSPAIDALVLRCLAKDPAARFASMDALADAIAAAVPGAVGSVAVRVARATSPGADAAPLVDGYDSTAASGGETTLGSVPSAAPRAMSRRDAPVPTTLGQSIGESVAPKAVVPSVDARGGAARGRGWIALAGASAGGAGLALYLALAGGDASPRNDRTVTPASAPLVDARTASPASRARPTRTMPDLPPPTMTPPLDRAASTAAGSGFSPAIDAGVPIVPVVPVVPSAAPPDAAPAAAAPPATPHHKHTTSTPPPPPDAAPPRDPLDLDGDGIPDIRR